VQGEHGHAGAQGHSCDDCGLGFGLFSSVANAFMVCLLVDDGSLPPSLVVTAFEANLLQ
jgi:hypothetical protein